MNCGYRDHTPQVPTSLPRKKVMKTFTRAILIHCIIRIVLCRITIPYTTGSTTGDLPIANDYHISYMQMYIAHICANGGV
jgi:hypothetical protein